MKKLLVGLVIAGFFSTMSIHSFQGEASAVEHPDFDSIIPELKIEVEHPDFD